MVFNYENVYNMSRNRIDIFEIKPPKNGRHFESKSRKTLEFELDLGIRMRNIGKNFELNLSSTYSFSYYHNKLTQTFSHQQKEN